MKEPIGAGFAGIVALAVGAAFGPGRWSAGRSVAALVAVVQLFCSEIASQQASRADGEITDAVAREIAGREPSRIAVDAAVAPDSRERGLGRYRDPALRRRRPAHPSRYPRAARVRGRALTRRGSGAVPGSR